MNTETLEFKEAYNHACKKYGKDFVSVYWMEDERNLRNARALTDEEIESLNIEEWSYDILTADEADDRLYGDCGDDCNTHAYVSERDRENYREMIFFVREK